MFTNIKIINLTIDNENKGNKDIIYKIMGSAQNTRCTFKTLVFFFDLNYKLTF